MEENWNTTIEQWLFRCLERIEWRYGEGRAPFSWPPRFYKQEHLYYCELDIEGLGKNICLKFSADSPEALLLKLKSELPALSGGIE